LKSKIIYILQIVAAIFTIVASTLAIIVATKAFDKSDETSAKTKEIQAKTEAVQKGLGELTQATMYLAYYTKIIAPENNQNFTQQYIPMEVSFGRDLNPKNHIWIVGFDGNNKYPLHKIDMAKGQRIWSANIELPHMQEWVLNVYQVDAENSKVLQAAKQSGQHLAELPSDVFTYLGSVNIEYNDKRGS